MVKLLSDRVEELPDEERLQIKTRAKLIKDEIYNRSPRFCQQPFDDMLNQICLSATFDEWETKREIHDNTTLFDVMDMLEGYADTLDVKAMNDTSEDGVCHYREQEKDFRKIAGLVGLMVEDGFTISPVMAPKI